MPIYDLYCSASACDYLRPNKFLKWEEDNGKCPKCGTELKRGVGCASFQLVYDNKKDICDWDGNTSQYYRAYNEAKERGEDVKLPDHDYDE